MRKKLNVLLAVTDSLASSFRTCVSDYCQYFSKNQGDFKGEMKTYEPASGTIDLPGERNDKRITTTVDEKLKWFEDTQKEYINDLFSQEATNASGTAKAELVVAGVSWGELSSLELLRLKSFVESGEFEKMYTTIPVRSDSERWEDCTADFYQGRSIRQSPKMEGTKKSVAKEHYILLDPNVTKENGAKYTPQVSQKDTIIDLGTYTLTRYSGEWSHRERAELLRRRQILLTAIITALKTANEVDAVDSLITSEKIFNYLHRGN